MRITFICPVASLAGGIRVIAVYARLLRERGHDVRVISLSGKVPPLHRRIRAALGMGQIKSHKGSTTYFDGMGDSHIVLNHKGPVTAEDVPDADVVIASFWETAPWVAALPASKGRKFYFLQGYETFKKGKSSQVSATYDLPLKKIAVSNYVARMLAENHQIVDVPVVPNSVDLNDFAAGPRTKNADFTVGFLYSGKPVKNIEMAIKIIEGARARIPGLKVKAFGSMAPLDRLPLPKWVEYSKAPQQEKIAQIYAGCDAWLFTSHHEGFGLPILEAMACGTPVLATRAGAAPEIVDGRNGSLLETSPEPFVDEMEHMATMSDEDWRAMSDAARKTAQSYSWDTATDQLLDCLRESVPA